ncbi:hypothetical protein J1N35_005281 [Gossypium stocksii]|uniref:Uncharacterized protein n=1 Tax=Gossypium stocksii TaxID=47602 RepID=A0A9D4AJ41_9ROSI|nr:hypothetical protein J1N35_005281 [Gossypium stocksii]
MIHMVICWERSLDNINVFSLEYRYCVYPTERMQAPKNWLIYFGYGVILSENYGKPDPANVAKVKALFFRARTKTTAYELVLVYLSVKGEVLVCHNIDFVMRIKHEAKAFWSAQLNLKLGNVSYPRAKDDGYLKAINRPLLQTL